MIMNKFHQLYILSLINISEDIDRSRNIYITYKFIILFNICYINNYLSYEIW